MDGCYQRQPDPVKQADLLHCAACKGTSRNLGEIGNPMVKIPGMLMVGAAERNAGKTTFACRLIKKFSANNDIIGVKVTTILEADGKCPRGGEGCGVCTSLEGNFCLTEEHTGPPGKDTTKLLEAGAARVFWLRVLLDHLDEGVSALLKKIGSGAVTVCESNSFRLAVEPDLFIMVKEKNTDRYKVSARNVREHVDRIALFDGKGFDIDPDDIAIVDGSWTLRERATAIILAGGKSLRMGRDKAMLPVSGRPMLDHVVNRLKPLFEEIIVSAGDSEKYDIPGARVVPDEVPGQGPLMGVASALLASGNDLNFIVACDMPEIDGRLVREMLAAAEGFDGVVPVDREGRVEPLFAVYNKSVLPTIRDLLASGQRRIVAMYPHHDIRRFPLEGRAGNGLKSLNTMRDYEEFKKREDAKRPEGTD